MDPRIGSPSSGLESSARNEILTARQQAIHFIEQLHVSDPEIAAMSLESEVDELLGRETPRRQKNTKRKHRRLSRGDTTQERSDFRWFEALLSRAPEADSGNNEQAAKSVELGLFARERLDRLDRRFLTRRELAAYRALIREGEIAWEWLLLSNLRLVFHWSKGVAKSIDSDWAEDAFQAGFLGLVRGLQGWDYSKGYRLSTFVSWHIRQHIQRWRANEVSVIRLPVHVWEQINNESENLSEELSQLVKRSLNLLSLDAMGDRHEEPFWNGGLDEIEESYDEEVRFRLLPFILTERQEEVLRLRFGLYPESPDPMTLEDIGSEFGLTRERIRQIEKSALEKLRGALSGV